MDCDFVLNDVVEVSIRHQRLVGPDGMRRVYGLGIPILNALYRAAPQPLSFEQLEIELTQQLHQVTEEAIRTAIGRLRKLFHDDRTRPSFIETKGGYRLIARIEHRGPSQSQHTSPNQVEAPPCITAGSPLANIDRHLYGRDENIVEVGRHLADPYCRMVVLHDSHGVGKSATASHVLEAIRRGQWPGVPRLFAGGIAYLSRQDITSENLERACEELLERGKTSRLSRCGPIKERLADLAADMCDRLFIIYLDNLEDKLSVDGVITDPGVRAFVEACLSRQGAPRLLATTTRAFNAGDRVVRTLRLNPVDAADCATLLRQRSHRLAQMSEAALQTIAGRCHHNPAVISLFAVLVEREQERSIEDLVADLYRQPRIHAMVEQAYFGFTEEHRLIADTLSVFLSQTGQPVQLEALEQALRSRLPMPVLHRCVTGMLNRRVLEGTDGAGRRLTMHPLLQDCAYGRLSSKPAERHALELRVADYYASIREVRDPCRSLNNVRPQLLEFEHRCNGGQYEQAADLLATFEMDCLTTCGYPDYTLRMHKRLDGHLTTSRLKAEDWLARGVAHNYLGEIDDALGCLENALQIATDINDPIMAGRSLGWMGELLRRKGDLENSKAATQRAVKLLGTNWRQAPPDRLHDLSGWTSELGFVSVYRGDVKSAVRYANKALKIAVHSGDTSHQGLAYDALALASLVGGDPLRSLEYAERSNALYRAAGENVSTYALNVHAMAHAALGHEDEALKLLDRAHALATEAKDSRPQALIAFNLARLHYRQKHAANAVRAVEEAVRLFSTMNGVEQRAASAFERVLRNEHKSRQAFADALMTCADQSISSPDLLDCEDLLTAAVAKANEYNFPTILRRAEKLAAALQRRRVYAARV